MPAARRRRRRRRRRRPHSEVELPERVDVVGVRLDVLIAEHEAHPCPLPRLHDIRVGDDGLKLILQSAPPARIKTNI